MSNLTIPSFLPAMEIVRVPLPEIFKGPLHEVVTFTSSMSPSITITFTGSVIFSPHPAFLGNVGRIISGDVTGTVLSAFPYALPLQATTITLTFPTYIGSFIL